MAVNEDDETPFHVAALNTNPDSIVAMLDTFPTKLSVGENSNFKNVVVPELLTICVGRGNARAVGRLVRYEGEVDYSDILRMMVDESVRHPAKTQLLVEVYYTIVDNVVPQRHSASGVPKQESAKYADRTRRTVLDLLTKPSPKDGATVMEHIMHVGAGRFLRAILHTPNVSRFHKATAGKAGGGLADQQHVKSYDVTNMTPHTQPAEDDKSQR